MGACLPEHACFSAARKILRCRSFLFTRRWYNRDIFFLKNQEGTGPMKDEDFLQGMPDEFEELLDEEDELDYGEEDSPDDDADVYEWEG